MNNMIVAIVWMAFPMLMAVSIPLIKHAQRADMKRLYGVQVFEAHGSDEEPCALCKAVFRPETDMPCHTDDGSIWGYKWKDEETLIRHAFPDGFFVDDEVVQSWKMNFPDKSAVNEA